ncbi:MAG: hypothetical protein H0U18_10450 [Pyrinomonadaceae bacterium]|jgi:hypothetical protein|nr:hypothetical protein [Pyrinomonadaceae bacterium]
MSDKDHRKKDGQNKAKKNQRMRESAEDRKQQNPGARATEKHEAKMTDTVPEGVGEDAKEAALVIHFSFFIPHFSLGIPA